MSEEGQKGQSKVDFDSADIGKKQKAVQFTEIEGAEERAKAAEKAKAAAEKAAEELHEANVEAVADRQVAIEKQEKLAKSGVLYKIFAGWHKWAILGVLLLIGAGIAVYLIFFNKPAEAVPAKEAAKAFYDEQVATVDSNNMDNFIDSYPEARDKMEQAWRSASETDAIWYGYYYALFVKKIGLNEVQTIEIMNSLDFSYLPEDEECELLNEISSEYDMLKDYLSEEIINGISKCEE